jgi:hypothetical protein
VRKADAIVLSREGCVIALMHKAIFAEPCGIGAAHVGNSNG